MKKWYNVANDGPFNSMCWQDKDGNFFKLVLTLSGWELWFVSQATGRERLIPPTREREKLLRYMRTFGLSLKTGERSIETLFRWKIPV